MVAALLLALSQSGSAASPMPDSAATGARTPAYASDGRLALSIRGDLWLRSIDGARWTQRTSGAAWDRQPAWSPDGRTLVFTSNRSGGDQIWRIAADGSDSPERVTASTAFEREPAVARDGTLAFVRGTGPLARIWIRQPDGIERRLTKKDGGAERWPAWSPEGSRVVYSAVTESRTRLRLHFIGGDSSRVLVEDRDAERAAWSRAGDRILFVTRSGRAGVWVTTPDARYINLVSSQRAEPAWSSDDRRIALAELPFADVGYNGDPDRLGDREARGMFSGGRLWFVDAPRAPDDGSIAATLPAADQAARNAERLARLHGQMDSLYYRGSPARRTRWAALRDAVAPRALAAASDSALDDVLHELLRERPALRDAATGRAAVSSAHPVATEAGLEILRLGGNVVDAAVAVSFALGVVEPDASGIGGYGQMLVQLAGMTRPGVVEFMARAPEEASLSNGSLLRKGVPPDDGPVLANVPGTVAGMETAWKRFGSKRVAWARLLAPAIRAAESGFVVSDGLATTLAREREHFLKYPSSRTLYFPNGQPAVAGDSLRNPDLAATLRAIADSGAAAFYAGGVAQRIVSDLRGKGNAMRPTDLSRYFAAEREPVSGTYRGHTIFSSAPPASGGATLVAQLNLLERVASPRAYTEHAGTLHAMVEAWKLVPVARGRVADPGLWPVRLEAYLSKDSAAVRWTCFNPDRSLAPSDIRGDSLPCVRPLARTSSAAGSDDEGACPGHDAGGAAGFCHRTGTTAFTVADADGNVVAVTQTLGTWGGNFYVAPGLGFLYNDKLTSYGADPEEYGARLPYARHGSTLAPTIVFSGAGVARRPVLAVGAAGNAWITSAVYSIVTGVIDQRLGAQAAIELPRFLLAQQRGAAGAEYVLQLEDGFAPAVMRRMRAIGTTLQPVSLPGELRMGYAAVVTIGARDVTAAADPRRAGHAGAVR